MLGNEVHRTDNMSSRKVIAYKTTQVLTCAAWLYQCATVQCGSTINLVEGKNPQQNNSWKIGQLIYSRSPGRAVELLRVFVSPMLLAHSTLARWLVFLRNLSPSRSMQAPQSSASQKALSYISYIGCSVSIVGLLLTVIFIIRNRWADGQNQNQQACSIWLEKHKLNFQMIPHVSPFFFAKREFRRKRHQQLLLCFSTSLLVAIIVFIAGIDTAPKGSKEGCRAVGILLHYFLLQSFFWMVAVALNVGLPLIFVFSSFGENLMQVAVPSALGELIWTAKESYSWVSSLFRKTQCL